MMLEAQAIGESARRPFRHRVDRRIEGAGDVGEHKTSMLQDLERGRPMEIDALVSAVQELGRLVDSRRRPSTPCWRWCGGWRWSGAAMGEMGGPAKP